MGKSFAKQPLGRPRIRWENEIDMNRREIRCKSGMFVELAGGFVVRALKLVVLNTQIPTMEVICSW